jgi:hypothetical protein
MFFQVVKEHTTVAPFSMMEGTSVVGIVAELTLIAFDALGLTKDAAYAMIPLRQVTAPPAAVMLYAGMQTMVSTPALGTSPMAQPMAAADVAQVAQVCTVSMPLTILQLTSITLTGFSVETFVSKLFVIVILQAAGVIGEHEYVDVTVK